MRFGNQTFNRLMIQYWLSLDPLQLNTLQCISSVNFFRCQSQDIFKNMTWKIPYPNDQSVKFTHHWDCFFHSNDFKCNKSDMSPAGRPLLRLLSWLCFYIKWDQLNPWLKDQLGKALLSTIWPLQLPNFVSCGRDKPSHMTQNLVTVGAKLLTGEWFLLVPWSMDQADQKQSLVSCHVFKYLKLGWGGGGGGFLQDCVGLHQGSFWI